MLPNPANFDPILRAPADSEIEQNVNPTEQEAATSPMPEDGDPTKQVESETKEPDPEGYRVTLQRLAEHLDRELRPEQTLAVEDSLAGLEAARRAGTRTLAVTNSYTRDELTPLADLVTERLAAVTDTQLAAIFT